MAIINLDTLFGDLAMWLSAIGTLGTLFFLSNQHIQNMKKEKEYKESKNALQLYLSNADMLIALISDAGVDRSRVIKVLFTTCDTLKNVAPKITQDIHLLSAETKHQELIVHLEIFYFNFKVGDIIETPDENVRHQSLSNASDSFADSSYQLVNTWLEHVVPHLKSDKKPDLSYGLGQNFIKDKYLYSLMALLVSNPKKEMLSYRDVETQFQAFNRSNPFDSCAKNEKRIIEIDNEWLMDLEQYYPLLFAHFAIKESGLIVEKKTVEGEETIYEPKIIIHGYEPKHGLDNVWFVLNRPTVTAALSVPKRLLQTKEKFIVRLNTKED